MADTPFIHNVAASVHHAQKATALNAGQVGKFSFQAKAPANLLGHTTFNPRQMAARFQGLRTLVKGFSTAAKSGKTSEGSKTEKSDEAETIEKIEAIGEAANEFSEKHDEFRPDDLLELLSSLSNKDTREQILSKVLKMYPDATLADEALDFLISTCEGDLQKEVMAAKADLNTRHGRDVRAGHNIDEQAREFSKKGLGTRSELRKIYRDVIDHPRDAVTLFQELATLYPDFDKMVQVIEFTLHSVGADVNAKGPSIERAELHRLMTECRSMQAILGVYRFFKSQMGPIADEFKRQGLSLPPRLTFQTLSKHYITFLQDRYPSAEKVFKLLERLGVGEELQGQGPIATRLRNACRNTAPKLFKTEQHRWDVIATFIEALAEIDEKLEELEGEEIGEAEGTSGETMQDKSPRKLEGEE